MAIKGSFIASSGKMVGSASERKYEFEVMQIDTEFHGTIGEDERDKMERTDLYEADRVMFNVKGGHLEKGETAYRWVGGPFPSQKALEEAIEDMMIYGSP